MNLSKTEILKYKELIKKKQGVTFSDDEIINLIQNMDNMLNLLFPKYLDKINENEKI